MGFFFKEILEFLALLLHPLLVALLDCLAVAGIAAIARLEAGVAVFGFLLPTYDAGKRHRLCL